MSKNNLENLIKSFSKEKKSEENQSGDITDLLQDIFDNIKTGKLIKGDRGKDGKNGKDGYTPIKNVDYFDGLQGVPGPRGKDGKDGYTPIKGTDYFDGKDGKDSPFQSIEDVIASINSNEEVIKIESIIGYKDLLKPIKEKIEKLEKRGSNYLPRKGFLDQRWHGGGGDGTITGSGTANQVAYWDNTSSITGNDLFTFDGNQVAIGDPLSITDLELAIGIQSADRMGLVIRTALSPTASAFEIQDSTGRPNLKMVTTGNNRLTISGSGTMVNATYSDFVLSIQSTGSDYSWLEILNNGGVDKGAFFGMAFNQFQLFNWQGGDIEFWTYPTASDGRVRFTITNDGNYGFDGTNAFSWGHGWGGGVGIIGIGDATTAPTTSLTTAVALYSVSRELWYMAASNQARKIVTSAAALTSGKYPIATTNGLLTDGPTPLAGTKVYYVADSSGGAVTRKLTFTNGILTAET